MNSEIQWRLEQSFRASAPLSEDLRRRVADAAAASGRSFETELAFWLESFMAQRSAEEASIRRVNAVMEDLSRQFQELQQQQETRKDRPIAASGSGKPKPVKKSK